jgi:hypothetical protein
MRLWDGLPVEGGDNTRRVENRTPGDFHDGHCDHYTVGEVGQTAGVGHCTVPNPREERLVDGCSSCQPWGEWSVVRMASVGGTTMLFQVWETCNMWIVGAPTRCCLGQQGEMQPCFSITIAVPQMLQAKGGTADSEER